MKLEITDESYAAKMTILDALHMVSDPELGINIVDLGLVYGIDVDSRNLKISISMTLSSKSCPLGNFITSHVKLATETAMPGYEAEVNLVWDPKWDASRISEQGKAELGW